MNSVFSFYYNGSEHMEQIEARVVELIAQRQFVCRLDHFYIIHFVSQEDWSSFFTSMNQFARATNGFLFILSPGITEGIYNGILPTTQWDEINQITNLH